MRIGKITENVLKRSVWKQIHNGKYKNGAAGYTDCALFRAEDINEGTSKEGTKSEILPEILSSVFCVTARVLACGKYAVTGACNNILAGGGKPLQVLLSITLPSDAQESVLRQIMKDAQEAANAFGAEIAGGHTEVSSAVKWPLVSVSAVGYKTGTDKRKNTSSKELKNPLKNEDDTLDIIVTKWIALSGTAMLAEEKGDLISKRYPAFIKEAGISFGKMDYLSIADEAKIAADNGALLMHDISSGGIFAALWELGQMAGLGMDVDLKAIPIRQETVEITDVFDVNPYLLASAGSLLIAAKDGSRIVKALEAEGIPATIIGKLTKGNDRIIRNEDETRFLDLPQSDEIHKVLAD